MNPLSPTLIFKKTYKVYINHTDAGGIVYHANHLTFFENCRRDWLASMGFDGYFFENDGQKIHFVVSQANVSYRLPLLVDDELVVGIGQIITKSASLIMHQYIYRNQADYQAGKVASTGIITLACVKNKQDGNIAPSRLPIAMKDALDDSTP